jgi:hypothetical protein
MNKMSKGTGNENKKNPVAGGCGNFYEICVKGQLDESWSEWLEGLEPEASKNGEMKLSGYIADQAAMMGILNKLSRLNLTLLSINVNRNK